MEYIRNKRFISDDTINLLNIGFCKKGMDVPGVNAGEKEFNRTNLEDKIVVPVYSEFGDFLVFSARSFVPDWKGWWNQPFDKNNHLFCLHLAKECAIITGKIYIVEGYFDAITLYQQGIKNVCAVMGTTLGHRKIGLLARYCDHICLCYDSDKKNYAGQLARVKSIYELHRYGWNNISYVSLPVGMDPDEFVLQKGIKEFYNLEKSLSKSDIIKISKKYNDFIKK